MKSELLYSLEKCLEYLESEVCKCLADQGQGLVYIPDESGNVFFGLYKVVRNFAKDQSVATWGLIESWMLDPSELYSFNREDSIILLKRIVAWQKEN